ncbi:uncharacterized protein LOC144210158 [Stigmatopora nigra]
MEMEREQVRIEVEEMLYKLTVNDLLEICDFLNIGKTKRISEFKLLGHIANHLERNELKDEDKGMSELLKLKEGIRMLYEDRRLGWQRLFGAKQAINSEHLASLEREKILKRDLEAMKQEQAKQRRDLLEQLSARNEAIENQRYEIIELKDQLDKTVGCLAKAAADVEAKELKLSSYEEEIARQKKLLALENLHTDEIVHSKDHIIKRLEEDISQQREAFQKKIDHLELQFEQAEQQKTDEIRILQEEQKALEKQVDMLVAEKEKLFQTKQATERENMASLQREEVLKEELELLKLEKVTFLKEREQEQANERLKIESTRALTQYGRDTDKSPLECQKSSESIPTQQTKTSRFPEVKPKPDIRTSRNVQAKPLNAKEMSSSSNLKSTGNRTNETEPEPTEIQKSNWKEPSNKLVHVNNCTHYDVTGYSPFYLLFGSSPRLPVDMLFGLCNRSDADGQQDYVEKLRRGMEEAYTIATENARKAAEKGKKHYDTKVRSSVLQPGERVLIKNLTPRGGPGKLRDFWEDTVHTVVKQMGSDLPIYEVRPERGKDRSRILHRNLLMSCDHLPVEITPEEGKIGTRTPRKKQQPASHQESDEESDDEDDFHYELRQLNERGTQEMEPEHRPLPVDQTHEVRGPASGPVQVEEDHQLEDLPGEGANPPLEGPSAEQLSETFPPTAVTEPEALTDERPRRERHPPRRTTYDHLGIPSCYSTQSPQERLTVYPAPGVGP